MASNTLKGTQSFQDTIKAYLETMAENDALFAVKYANPSKSVSDCCTFIINQVQKSGCNGFADIFDALARELLMLTEVEVCA